MVNVINYQLSERTIKLTHKSDIEKSLEEFEAELRGEPNHVITNTIVLENVEIPDYSPKSITAIRKKTHATQEDFAWIMGIRKRTVISWETGKTKPRGSARRLLQLLKDQPTALDHILHR